MENTENKQPEKKDYLDGDHSAKNWFKIMFRNSYIQIFTVGLVLFILQLCYFNTMVDWFLSAWEDGAFGGIMVTLGLMIPISVMVLVLWLGFIRFWNDLKNGRSR